MAKLSLSEVSKKFHIDRSTIYRAVRNGRLSQSIDRINPILLRLSIGLFLNLDSILSKNLRVY